MCQLCEVWTGLFVSPAWMCLYITAGKIKDTVISWWLEKLYFSVMSATVERIRLLFKNFMRCFHFVFMRKPFFSHLFLWWPNINMDFDFHFSCCKCGLIVFNLTCLVTFKGDYLLWWLVSSHLEVRMTILPCVCGNKLVLFLHNLVTQSRQCKM